MMNEKSANDPAANEEEKIDAVEDTAPVANAPIPLRAINDSNKETKNAERSDDAETNLDAEIADAEIAATPMQQPTTSYAPPPPPSSRSSGTPLAVLATLIALTAAGGGYYLWMELIKVEQMTGRTAGVTQAQLDSSQQTFDARIEKATAEQQATLSSTRADLEQRIGDAAQRNEQNIATAREQMQAGIDAARADLTTVQTQRQTDRAALEQAIAGAKSELDTALQKSDSDNQAAVAAVQAAVAEAKGAFNEFRDQINARFAAQDQMQAALRATVTDAQQELNRTVAQHRIEWTLTDVEHLLRAANTQAAFEHNIVAAVMSMRAAQQRLHDLDNPAMKPAVEALDADVHALQQVTVPDTATAAVALTRMARQSVTLPLASDKPAAKTEPAASNAAEKVATGAWDTVRGLAAAAWDSVRGLVVVRKQGEAAVPLLPPDETYFLQQNLRLQLETARLALLREDDAAYHEALNNVEAWINKYYAASDAQTQAFVASLHELQPLQLNVTVPDISNSLNAFRQSAAAILGTAQN